MKKIAVFWFRRDLRLNDNHGLFRALSSGLPVLPVFVFDTKILDKLASKTDARVSFIYSQVQNLKNELEKMGSSLFVFHGEPVEMFEKLTADYQVETVFANHDYEPYAKARDEQVAAFLLSKGIRFETFKDQVIFEKGEVAKDDGTPYTVFTPFSRKWKQKLSAADLESFPSENLGIKFLKTEAFKLSELQEIGFEKSTVSIPDFNISEPIIRNYAETRDIPAIEGTSKLGIYLRFGVVSIRKVVKLAMNWSEVFLNELIWREFFMQILWHFPRVETTAFKPQYDLIGWRNSENEFEKWCNGQTGYPLVDAGMREMNATGFMHNRVRMVTASFLTKHLLVDWRWGEAYFAEKLLDFELSANNGNWQWAAGCGCDAAPYFRVFNPESQQKKFDPELKYILKWVPEYGTIAYFRPIVEHTFARERVLNAYKNALK
jgi:deoxyribodipyrimidine photo-lyase